MAQPVWNTAAGSLGSYPIGIPVIVYLSASPVLPATSVTYTLISGSLPAGLSFNSSGIISGTPTLVTSDVTSSFAVRATDDKNNIRDRTFQMTVSGSALPQFTTPEGNLLGTLDSVWIELPIAYSNPVTTNQVAIQLIQGSLPPGLEIDETGVIRGYADQPVNNVTYDILTSESTGTNGLTNEITCVSTNLFTLGRPVIFSGSVFGGVVANATYYVKSITSTTTFTISNTQFGDELLLSSSTGLMTITLPPISVGQPTIRTYSFTLGLFSDLGNDTAAYSITITNQNTPVSQGGPGNPINTRTPTILNTRPLTYNLTNEDPYYGYYVLPPVLPSVAAQIPTIQSDNYFAFKILGHDFDGNAISYSFSGLPLGLVGDTVTGWITGTPIVDPDTLNNYTFNVRVFKSGNEAITTPNFNFGITVARDIVGTVIWNTPSDLGTIYNGGTSSFAVNATSDVPLIYSLVSGELPPNLTFNSNGEILGNIADQPSDSYLNPGDTLTFTFTVEAYSEEYPTITSTKTFTITVEQRYVHPMDTLYIKATPDLSDRAILDSLLTSESLIPPEAIYRADDINFGKATSVIYEHAYGIYASDINQYLAAVTRNHYWRSITLGEIKTAIARNANGDIVYEVVYSEVIDNLENPQGTSISSSIYWPRPIDLGLGPWYTSLTNVYTSYESILGQQYYTSLTPGYARTLYPNSLYNMRNRVSDVLGQEYDSNILPLWMTSQQTNGSTLGFTKAWVICYTKPGYSSIVKDNITNNWPYTLNQINFEIDRFTVNKSMTFNYDNSLSPPAWTSLPSGQPVPNPIDSKDFYVLFPRETILPDTPQY